MPKHPRIAVFCSVTFHLGLSAVLAYQGMTAGPLEVRVGHDSVVSLTMQMPESRVEPPSLDTPVVVTRREARIADRRLLETATHIDPMDLQDEPDVAKRAQTLSHRLERPMPPRREPAAATPTPAPVETPKPVRKPSRKPALHSTASMAQSRTLGAKAKPRAPARIIPPVFVDARPPVFPTEARSNGWTGVVLLVITVDATGQVTEVKVDQTSGHATLDAAAVRAVRTWRGRPATRDGVPFESRWKKPFRFE